MSFPGYLKSLKLKNSRLDEATPKRKGGDLTKISPEHNDKVPQSGSEGAAVALYTPIPSSSSSEVRLIDDKGNAPTISLWVGNIPPRATDSALRALFSSFGSIVSTKISAKYAFVNFETTESAIAAFNECHDQDVFATGNSRVYIRFAAPRPEVKPAKDRGKPRRGSMSTKAESAQRQWFGPVERNATVFTNESGNTVNWPNGKPPTGPKSQKRDISPPPLRRNDSHRAPILPRRESYRTDSGVEPRWSGGAASRQGSGTYSSYRGFTAARSRSTSLSLCSSRSCSTSPDLAADRGRTDSPLPWERHSIRKQGDASARTEARFCNAVRDVTPGRVRDAVEAERASELLTVAVATSHSMDTICGSPDGYSPTLSVRMTDTQDPNPGAVLQDSLTMLDSPETVTRLAIDECVSILDTKQPAESPPFRALSKVFHANNSVRDGSVASDVVTSSTKTSVRKRRCGDCKKIGGELSPLIPCSKCTRRFHSGCGDPRPSARPDKAKFVCGRCTQGLELGEEDAAIPASRRARNTVVHNYDCQRGQPRLIESSLAPGQSSVTDKHQPSLESSSHTTLSAAKFKSLFSIHDDDDDGHVVPTVESPTESERSVQPVVAWENSQNTLRPTDRSAGSTLLAAIVAQQENEGPEQKARKYKCVTCKWWASGSCTQSEDKCYYAHDHTNISLPGGKRFNKDWTCFDWLQGACRKSSQDCLYAHENTGLYIWLDGQPSFKHVTCYWWIRSHCKFSDDMCKFAHRDTGLYGLDPSEKWHGGAKFTTMHPASASNWGERPFPRPSYSDRQSFTHLAEAEALVKKNGLVNLLNDDSSRPEYPSTSSTTPGKLVDPEGSSSQRQKSSVALTKPRTTKQVAAPVANNVTESSTRQNSFTQIDTANRNSTAPAPVDGVPCAQFSLNGLMQALRKYKTSQQGQQTLTDDSQRQHNSVIDMSSVQTRDIVARPWAFAAQSDVNDSMQVDVAQPTGQAKLKPRGLGPEHGPAVESSDGVCGSMRSEHSSRDPRLARRDQIDASLGQSGLQQSGHTNEGAENGVRPRIDAEASTTTKEGPATDELSRKLRRCKTCHKTVFGTEFCRNCSSNHVEQAPTITIDVSTKADEEPLTSPQASHRVVNVTDVLVKDLGNENKEPSTQPVVKNPLKRSASGTNMFLKNKRPKSSMLFSSGGRLQARPNTQKADRQTLQADGKLVKGVQQVHQSLEDLIRQKHTKNRSQPVRSPPSKKPAYRHDSSDKGTENEIPDSTDEPMSSRESSPIRHENRARANGDESNRLWADTSPPTSPRSSSNPAQSFERPYEAPATRVLPKSNRSDKSDARGERSNSPGFPDLTDARPIQEVQLIPDEEPLDKEHHKVNENTCVDLGRPQNVMAESATTRTRASKADTELARNAAASPVSTGRVQWASSLTCNICRKKHKKCVHSRDGSLSAQKCREYVLSRRGKRDTGRPNYEWQAILAAAGLDADSDGDEDDSAEEHVGQDVLRDADDDSDSDSDETMQTASSDSGDNVTNTESTRYDEDDFSASDVNDEGGKNFTGPGRNQPPRIIVNIPISKRASPVKDDDLTSSHSAPKSLWSMKAERHALVELKRRGVMFESDSEDDDYLSDEGAMEPVREQVIDALHVPPKQSRDLFEIAPELDSRHTEQQNLGRLQPLLSRPSRKEQWANVRSNKLQEQREIFGDAHCEVKRKYATVVVTAMIERVVSPVSSERDTFAVGSVQMKEEKISFGEFLGVPKSPKACLMSDGRRLAFRDGRNEMDRMLVRSSRGLVKKLTDDDKFPMRVR